MKGVTSIYYFDQPATKIEELQSYIQEMEAFLGEAPTGSLRINHNNGKPCYYWQNTGKDKEPAGGFYIPKKEEEFVRVLAKKSYYKKALPIAKQLKSELSQGEDSLLEAAFYDLYYGLHEDKKKLITPFVMSDEDYIAQWKGMVYEAKEFEISTDRMYKTCNNELRRSKSEVIITNLFVRYDIPYRYEPMLRFSKNRYFYPDFQLLNKRTRKEYYWEHMGMMGDPDYQQTAIEKINYYTKHGYIQGKNMIYTFESSTRPLDTEVCKALIEEYLL